MRTIKQWLAMVLAVCMLVGLPISVSRAETTDAPLTMTKAELLVTSGDNAGRQVKVTFSEEVALPVLNNYKFHFMVARVSNGKTQDAGYTFTWGDNDSLALCDTSAANNKTTWGTMLNFGETAAQYGVEGKNVVVFTQKSSTPQLHRLMTIYQTAIAKYGEKAVRLVARFVESTGDNKNDGVINGIYALDDSTKCLGVTDEADSIGYDWAGIDVSVLHVTEATVYADNKLAITFNEPLDTAILGENTTWTLGWAPQREADAALTTGIIDTTKSSWPMDMENVYVYPDNRTLLVTLPEGAYTSIKNNAPVGYSLTVAATDANAVDGVVNSMKSEDGISLTATKKPGASDQYYYDHVEISENTKPLIIERVELAVSDTDVNKGIKVFFSEPVNTPTVGSFTAHLIVLKVNEDTITNNNYYYTWQGSTTASAHTIISDTNTGAATSNAMWNCGKVEVTRFQVNGEDYQSGLLLKLENPLNHRAVSIYEKVVAAYGEENCCLALRFKEQSADDVTATPDIDRTDGYINGITAQAKDSDGSAKYLKDTSETLSYDWAVAPVSILRVTNATVYADDKLAITFNGRLSVSDLGEKTKWQLGWFKNGVIDTSLDNWTISSGDVSFYSDNQTLLVSLPEGVYQAVNGVTKDGYTLSITATDDGGTLDGVIDGLAAVNYLQLNTKKHPTSSPDLYYYEGVGTSAETALAVAEVDGTTYDTIGAALKAAKVDSTVALLQSVATDMVTVPSDVTLDLNGHILTCKNIIAFGYVIDSTEGTGALAVSRDKSVAFIHLQQDNPYFPIYDDSIDGYRFYTYSIANVGTKIVDNTRVKYGIKLQFGAMKAYELLADDANADIEFVVDMKIGYNSFYYRFNHSILNDLYQTIKKNGFSNRGKYAVTLTIKGLPEDGNGIDIVAQPIIYSAQMISSCGDHIAYEGNYDSYTRAKAWIKKQIENNSLFSFDYDGIAYESHITSWDKTVDETENGWTVTYEKDGVVAWSEITFDPETASVEWTNYFKNNGSSASPRISNIRAMDSAVTVENPTLTSANGSEKLATDFQPFSKELTQETYTMSTKGGRSSQGAFPYFDISNGEYGIMGAIGWTGNWNANFVNDDGKITIDAGMLETDISLEENEQMRTPMIMIQFFKGDQDDGHNAFRQLMLKSYTPSDESGKPIDHAMLSVGVVNYAGQGEDAIMTNIIDKLDAKNSPYECLWIDAGWYGNMAGDNNLSDGTWNKQAGNWYFVPSYENGIKNISQHLKEQNKELLLWFEPERVVYETELYQDDLILRQKPKNSFNDHGEYELLGKIIGPSVYLYNFADDSACNEMINRISTLIQENGVTWYRQDFNIDPEDYWSYNDKTGRTGMTEIKYVTNLYRYLDALVEQNPGLMIDSCASGGKRLDLEMMKRSVPLWNSDYAIQKDSEGNLISTMDGIRANNYNLSWWLPIHSGGWPNQRYNDSSLDRYKFRVAMNSGMQLECKYAADPYTIKTYLPQYFKCRELMNGDYYILATGKGDAIETQDACYEFYKEEVGQGYVMAFRPENCTTESAVYQLKGLNERATYELKWVDTGDTVTATGKQLMEEGLTVTYSKAILAHLIYITEK